MPKMKTVRTETSRVAEVSTDGGAQNNDDGQNSTNEDGRLDETV